MNKGVKLAVLSGDLAPLIVGSAENAVGCDFLLEIIGKHLPSPSDVASYVGEHDGEEVERKVDNNEPFSAVVFKTIVDPFVGN